MKQGEGWRRCGGEGKAVKEEASQSPSRYKLFLTRRQNNELLKVHRQFLFLPFLSSLKAKINKQQAKSYISAKCIHRVRWGLYPYPLDSSFHSLSSTATNNTEPGAPADIRTEQAPNTDALHNPLAEFLLLHFLPYSLCQRSANQARYPNTQKIFVPLKSLRNLMPVESGLSRGATCLAQAAIAQSSPER